MDFRKLRHAVTLSRFHSFTRAAQELNITQSALSRSIQALEKECRLQLFDRSGGLVAPTQSGRDFIRHAEALLRDEAALRNVVAHAAEGEGGHVTLGVTPLVARTLLAPILAQRVGRQHFHAEVMIGSSKEILAMTARETVDLGICTGDPAPDTSPFSRTQVAHLPLAAIVRADHPLAGAREINAQDIEGYPLVRSPPYSFESELPAVIGLSRPAVTVEDYDVLEQIVETSDAVWVTSPVAAQAGIVSGRLKSLQIVWMSQARVTLAAFSLKQRTLSPIARSILEHFQALGAELTQS